MVTSDAYADASEAAAISTAASTAESKDVARMVTSDAYADASEAAAIASAESKDIARMVTSDAYADASEAAAKSFATAADTTLQGTLQGNIDVENARIDAILLSADADKDTFVEIVTLINAVDTTNDTALGAEIVLRASGDTAAVASAESKDVARMVTSDAYADQAELDAIASAESKDVARASTAVSNIATAKTEAIASAESKDVARMVTSDAYADASEAAAISTAASTAESKDIARMVTSDAYADAAESAAIASAESKDVARMVTSDAYADASEAAAISTAAATAASLDTTQTTANKLVWEAYADQAETDAVATAAADATAKVAVLTAGASASLDTLLEIANVMATDAELTSAIGALNHDSLSGFVANEHIDWTADQGATNVHAGNYTDTNTTYSVGDGGLTQVNFTTADNSKLDGIELLAKDDQTASEILTLIKTVDGAGSGLDADLLDGNSSAYFTGYADTAETDAIASAATAAQTKVDALESSMTHFHSSVQSVTAAEETDNTSSTTDYTFSELTNARHYALYINRQLMRAAEYSVSGTTVTIVSGILALDDELEVTGFSS